MGSLLEARNKLGGYSHHLSGKSHHASHKKRRSKHAQGVMVEDTEQPKALHPDVEKFRVGNSKYFTGLLPKESRASRNMKIRKETPHKKGKRVRGKHSIGDMIHETGSLIGNAAKPYVEKAGKAANFVNKLDGSFLTRGIGNKITKNVTGMADKYGKKISDTAQNFAGKASGFANDVAGKVTGKGAGLAKAAADTLSGTARSIGDKVSNLARNADAAVHKALPGHSNKLINTGKTIFGTDSKQNKRIANQPTGAAFYKGGEVKKNKRK